MGVNRTGSEIWMCPMAWQKSNAMNSEAEKTFIDVDTLTAFFIFMFKKIKFI